MFPEFSLREWKKTTKSFVTVLAEIWTQVPLRYRVECCHYIH